MLKCLRSVKKSKISDAKAYSFDEPVNYVTFISNYVTFINNYITHLLRLNYIFQPQLVTTG